MLAVLSRLRRHPSLAATVYAATDSSKTSCLKCFLLIMTFCFVHKCYLLVLHSILFTCVRRSQYHVYQLESEYDSGSIYYRNQSLCDTVSGNSVPLLTITSHPLSYDKEGIDQLSTLYSVFNRLIQVLLWTIHFKNVMYTPYITF